MTSEFSWQSSVSLCLLHFVLQGQTCLLLRVFLDFLLFIPVPYNEKYIFWGCQFQKILQVFIELFTFSFFSIPFWGTELDYCNIEWFAQEMNRYHFVVLEIAPNYCILDSFVDSLVDYMWWFISGLSILLHWTTAAKSLQSCLTLCDPKTAAHQAPPSLGFSRQEHWSGLPFPSPVHESEK